MKKKTLTFLLGTSMLLALSACGKKEPEVLPDEIFSVGDYRLTAQYREDSVEQQEKSVDYIRITKDTNAVWYGTYADGVYYQIVSKDGITSSYVNDEEYTDFWTHEDMDLKFEEYDAMVHNFFTPDHLRDAAYVGDAELEQQYNDPENGFVIKKITAQKYEKDTSDCILLWDDKEKYTVMTTDFLVAEGRIVYGILELKGEEGTGLSITYNTTIDFDPTLDYPVPEESAFMTLQEYSNKQAGFAMNDEGETAFDLMDLSYADIEEQTADGFYYADGTYTYSHPNNYQSWKRIVNGEVTEEFDLETNRYVNHLTGQIIENVAEKNENGEVVVSNGVYGEDIVGTSAAMLTDPFNMSLNQIKGQAVSGMADPRPKDWKFLLEYNSPKMEELYQEHNDIVPSSIRSFVQDFYNNQTLQTVLDKLKGNKYSEDERYVIAYIAYCQNCVITGNEMAQITLKDLFTSNGLDVEQYYYDVMAGNGPWKPSSYWYAHTYEQFKAEQNAAENPTTPQPEVMPQEETQQSSEDAQDDAAGENP